MSVINRMCRHIAAVLLPTLLLVSVSALAEPSCGDRLRDLATPVFPKTPEAGRAIRKAPCSVDVIYALDADGAVTVVAAGSVERCKLFETAAKTAVAMSEFFAGKIDGGCTIRISFTADERNTMALTGPRRGRAASGDSGFGGQSVSNPYASGSPLNQS